MLDYQHGPVRSLWNTVAIGDDVNFYSPTDVAAIRIRFTLPNDVVTDDARFHLPANVSAVRIRYILPTDVIVENVSVNFPTDVRIRLTLPTLTELQFVFVSYCLQTSPLFVLGLICLPT